MDSKKFCCEGNLFADLESLPLKVDITPRQHKLSSEDYVMAWNRTDFRRLYLHKPLMLSLPSNDDLKSLLSSLSTRLTNRYLVTRVIRHLGDPDSSTIRYLCDIAKPFVWYRNEALVLHQRGGRAMG